MASYNSRILAELSWLESESAAAHAQNCHHRPVPGAISTRPLTEVFGMLVYPVNTSGNIVSGRKMTGSLYGENLYRFTKLTCLTNC